MNIIKARNSAGRAVEINCLTGRETPLLIVSKAAKLVPSPPMREEPLAYAAPTINGDKLTLHGDYTEIYTVDAPAEAVETLNHWLHVLKARTIAAEDAKPDFLKPLGAGQRFQHLIVNVGAFNNVERMEQTFAEIGEAGWELVTAYDKASNWIGGMEKGFLLFKRPVPEGVDVRQWSFSMSKVGT